MYQNFDFGKGSKIIYIDFDVNKNKTLEEQVDILKEDLIQVTYENNYLLDIGWYPEFTLRGSFRVSIIKGYNWDKPIFQKSCRELQLLDECIKESIYLIQSIIY